MDMESEQYNPIKDIGWGVYDKTFKKIFEDIV